MGLCAVGDGSVHFYHTVDTIAEPQVESRPSKIKQKSAAAVRWTVLEDPLATQTNIHTAFVRTLLETGTNMKKRN